MRSLRFIGIVGGDDIRMVELGGGFDFALEAGQRQPGLRLAGGKHLQGHDALHAAMFGLEDLPHATGPDQVDERVIAEDQALRLAAADRLALKAGQAVVSHQGIGQFPSFFRAVAVRQTVDEAANLVGTQQPAA